MEHSRQRSRDLSPSSTTSGDTTVPTPTTTDSGYFGSTLPFRQSPLLPEPRQLIRSFPQAPVSNDYRYYSGSASIRHIPSNNPIPHLALRSPPLSTRAPAGSNCPAPHNQSYSPRATGSGPRDGSRAVFSTQPSSNYIESRTLLPATTHATTSYDTHYHQRAYYPPRVSPSRHRDDFDVQSLSCPAMPPRTHSGAGHDSHHCQRGYSPPRAGDSGHLNGFSSAMDLLLCAASTVESLSPLPRTNPPAIHPTPWVRDSQPEFRSERSDHRDGSQNIRNIPSDPTSAFTRSPLPPPPSRVPVRASVLLDDNVEVDHTMFSSNARRAPAPGRTPRDLNIAPHSPLVQNPPTRIAPADVNGGYRPPTIAVSPRPPAYVDHVEGFIARINTGELYRDFPVSTRKPCPLAECPGTFTRRGDVVRHLEHVHLGNKVVCDGCSRVLSRGDVLERHLERCPARLRPTK